MLEVRHYIVTQVREVKVTANNAEEAMIIAGVAFEHGQNADAGVKMGDLKRAQGIWGNTSSRIREVELNVKEDRH